MLLMLILVAFCSLYVKVHRQGVTTSAATFERCRETLGVSRCRSAWKYLVMSIKAWRGPATTISTAIWYDLQLLQVESIRQMPFQHGELKLKHRARSSIVCVVISTPRGLILVFELKISSVSTLLPNVDGASASVDHWLSKGPEVQNRILEASKSSTFSNRDPSVKLNWQQRPRRYYKILDIYKISPAPALKMTWCLLHNRWRESGKAEMQALFQSRCINCVQQHTHQRTSVWLVETTKFECRSFFSA